MIDTHAHYDDAIYDADRAALFARAREAGVTHIIQSAADVASLARIDALLPRFDLLYASVGLHPECAADLEKEALERHLSLIRSFAQNGALPAQDETLAAASGAAPADAGARIPGARQNKVVAIGEIGLDYHYDTPSPDAPDAVKEKASSWDHGTDPVNWPPRRIQKDVFYRQIALAKELDLPMVIHSRDAAADTLAILRETDAGAHGCDMHCFGYSKESAREFLDAGCYLGIGGVSTFKNGKKLKEVIAYAPLDRLLLETDAPYLAPEPHRGTRNESAYLVHVVQAIAQIKSISEEDVIAQTTRNAYRLFARLQQG